MLFRLPKKEFFLPAILLGLIVLPLGVGAQSVAVTPAQSDHSYERLFYYREGKLARHSFFSHPKSIDIFAPQTYEIDKTGTLIGKVDQALLTFAAKHGIKVMPLVTNKGFSKAAYEIILNDADKQRAAIEALVAEAKKHGYWGWQIDFEQMESSARDQYTAFIKNASVAMKENSLVLSVAVMAHISDDPSAYQKDLWRRILGVYDYAALASSADFVTVMSYDDPTSKGPVAGYVWLTQVLEYSLARIPKEKLSLGIPLYYWLWNDSTGKLVGIGGNEGIQNVFQKHNVAVHYSPTEHAMRLTFWKNAKSHTLWYENSRSIKKKLALITENGLRGFSAWALGLEHPSIHTVVKR